MVRAALKGNQYNDQSAAAFLEATRGSASTAIDDPDLALALALTPDRCRV